MSEPKPTAAQVNDTPANKKNKKKIIDNNEYCALCRRMYLKIVSWTFVKSCVHTVFVFFKL